MKIDDDAVHYNIITFGIGLVRQKCRDRMELPIDVDCWKLFGTWLLGALRCIKFNEKFIEKRHIGFAQRMKSKSNVHEIVRRPSLTVSKMKLLYKLSDSN